MASVLIKNLPDTLHRQLKERAQRHHRSLNKEVITLIEAALTKPREESGPESVKPRNPLTQNRLEDAWQGRTSRIQVLRGKYASALSSSEAFAARKVDEIEMER